MGKVAVKFAAVIEYDSDRHKIAELRPAHRGYLAALHAAGRLALAGRFADDSGALIIYEAGSVEDARRLIEEDPFHRGGVFVRYQLRAWNPVIGAALLSGT